LEVQVAVVEVEQISKTFGPLKAVDEVSFSVEKGEIFGLLGPNGAGKTTIIRVILDIFKPDQGRVAVLDGPMSEAKKDRIGYMPEERGLYQDISIERCLLYLASLKGLSQSDARRRLDEYLERFDLNAHRRKKVKELSKGMQQKAQLIATLLHEPELLIIDEPFSGLDPVNTQVVKDLLLDLHRQGTTIIMCTHQMHQVEELCERIVLINRGQAVLYGELDGIRRRFAGHAVLVRMAAEAADGSAALSQLPGVERVEAHNSALRLSLSSGAQPQEVLRALVDRDVPLEGFEIAEPTLDEIFIHVVQGGTAGAGGWGTLDG
jgi:ABC-2 type transport system ATP-binding protein